MKTLTPLAQSHANGQLEREMKALLIRLFQKYLAERAADINLYGLPYAGSSRLNARSLAANAIGGIEQNSATEESLRFLTQAVHYNNQKRGTWLLRTFIRCLWGSDFTIRQVWQKKNGRYPQDCKTAEAIQEAGGNLSDYFLTSRLSIELFGGDIEFPNETVEIIKGILPARLFIHEIHRNVVLKDTGYFGNSTHLQSHETADGEDVIEPIELTGAGYGFGLHASIYSYVEGTSRK